jgi:hypothetical protein
LFVFLWRAVLQTTSFPPELKIKVTYQFLYKG